MSNTIYKFGKGINTGMFDATVVGGKGAKLAEMGSLGLPVPAGVTLTTACCNHYLTGAMMGNEAFIADLVNDVLTNYEDIATDVGYMPLVSVRSGARVSMPGMMDTILNVGINNDNMSEWIDRLGSDAAADCYKRLIMMYSDTVTGIPAEAFEGMTTITDLLIRFEDLTGEKFPQTIEEQLAGSIEAVFNSWNSERALAYRAMSGYSDDWGTAVNVQQMVFGNHNDDSCSGVLFTRDFNTGAQDKIIDWLPNAQGEDVVAGTHTPKTKDEMYTWNFEVTQDLSLLADKMEEHYNDMQDMEFTVDDGELFILQTRDGKRSALAAFQIAHDFMEQGKISMTELLTRVTAKQYIALHNPSIDPSFNVAPCVTGVGAAGSIVTGIAVLTSADAVSCNEDCILVTEETTPNDFPGMKASVGILTRTGGITSHAAVVARGMDKTCVVGAEDITIMGNAAHPAGIAGKKITIDGATGRVWVDQNVPVIAGAYPAFVDEIIDWAMSNDTTFLSVTPESVPTDSTVLVDVSGNLGTQTSLSKALDGLKASYSNGIISFGKNAATDLIDSDFLNFFGVTSNDHDAGTYLVIEKVLGLKKWNKTFKHNWTIHLPSASTVEFANVLRSHGWKVVTVVNSFKAALSIDGYVVIEDSFKEQLTRENMNFSDIETLICQAGRTITELPVAVTKSRRLFDVLGG